MPSSRSTPGVDPALIASSPRRRELLDASYRHVLDNGLTGLSLRPLASAIGSSPRVLLFLFGSKDGLVREILARARVDELDLLDRVRADVDLTGVMAGRVVWEWLAADEHRNLLTLWVDTYARSVIDPDGPWSDFAAATVRDWLDVFRDLAVGRDRIDRTLVLAVLRGALLDLLATGDRTRVSAAVHRFLDATFPSAPEEEHASA